MTDPRGHETVAGAWAWVAAIIALFAVWRLAAAWLLPITQDEAYYADWARHLSWGYFDHPPGVALLGIGTWLAPESALAARLGGVAAGVLTLAVLARLYWNSGLRAPLPLALATLLVAATLPGLVGGFVLTPDTPLALAWALALHEAQRALGGARRRWISAGLATGLGLLGKYTMVIIGPVFLWAILAADPRALRSPWPYLGALAAILVVAPNLAWNADHDWLTLRFQFGHGFALDTGALVEGGGAGTITHSGPQSISERLASLLGFIGTQLGFWGLLAPAILALPWIVRRRARSPSPDDDGARLDARSQALLLAATLFPLGFFALVALVSSVEANWPVMYLLAAPALLAATLTPHVRWLVAAALGNLLLVSLYVVHGASAALPLPDSQNRILRETHGYRELAQRVAGLDGPVFADRYQTTAMLRFYLPDAAITQWPGLSRPSAYLQGQIAPRVSPDAITAPLWLVSRGAPPTIDGMRLDQQRSLFDCPRQPLTESTTAPCPKPLHQWQLYRFVPVP